jgi:hypothetical protein
MVVNKHAKQKKKEDTCFLRVFRVVFFLGVGDLRGGGLREVHSLFYCHIIVVPLFFFCFVHFAFLNRAAVILGFGTTLFAYAVGAVVV